MRIETTIDDVKPDLPLLFAASISRCLERLRGLKLINRATDSYRYYLTRLSRNAIAAACRITERIIVPVLAA